MMGGGMTNGLWFGGFGGLGLIGAILNLVITVGLIVGVVLLIIWLIRRVGPSVQGTDSARSQLERSPREILQTRYARGEITREEFQEILADLN